MNISRAGNLVQQFLDFDGTPLSNGVLCTFIAGTTTPIATYRDNQGSFNETEIKLNSRGECDVWLDASVKYKFVLKKADGSVVWAKDDVMAGAVYELPSRIVDTVEGDGDVSVTAVMDGDSIKYIVRLNKEFATKEELEEGLHKIRPEFVFNENVDAEKFAEAFTSNYVLVYEKSVTNPASRSNTTRRFLLSKKEQRLGDSSVSLTFECTEGETLHKVVVSYDIAGNILNFGDIDSYGIKDKDDELAAALNEEIAERQQADSVLAESFQDAVARLENKDDELEAELNGKASSEELAEEIEARQQADTAIESMVRESVERLEQKDIEIEESVNGKLGSVAHDSTLQGDGTADNPLKVVGGGPGGGIEEAPDDGKQYARKNKSWEEVHGGVSSWDEISGKPSEFPPSAHNHSVDDITDFPAIPTKTSDLQNDSGYITSGDVPQATYVAAYGRTTFADIQSAISEGKCVKCDMTGYTYELVNELPNKITFSATNNVDGVVTQETVWINSDNTWNNDGINLAKASDVPSKTSDLTNDAGFAKLVVSDTPPAEGTLDDVVTVILGNAAGGGDYGAWELIGEGTDIATNTQIDLSRGIKEFDFVILQAFGLYNSKKYYGSCIYNTGTISYGSTDIYCGSDYGNGVRICFLSSTQIKIIELFGSFKSFKLYGINLRGKENVYSTEERAIGKWIDGKTIYSRTILSPVVVEPRGNWTTILTDASIKHILKCNGVSSYNGADQLYSSAVFCRAYKGNIQLLGQGLCGFKVGDPITIEYTKNEG